MIRQFLIADLHFGHKNIIDYESRPFKSVLEMDNELVALWNKTVKDEDMVYVLGDFSFSNKERTTALVGMLKGTKVLVLGNHDRSHSDSWWLDTGFSLVSRYPMMIESNVLLSHEPMYQNMTLDYVNVFGHVHGNKEYADYSASHFCVSCERIGYKPIELDRVLDKVFDARFEMEFEGAAL